MIIVGFKSCNEKTDPAIQRLQDINDSLYQIIDVNNIKTDSLFLKIDRWCAGAMTAVTTVAGSIAMGSYDIAIAGGVEHMGNHPMGELMDPNPRYLAEKLVDPDALAMGATAERLHDKFPHLTKSAQISLRSHRNRKQQLHMPKASFKET